MFFAKLTGLATCLVWAAVATAQGPWPVPGPWAPPTYQPPAPAAAGTEKCDPPTGTAQPTRRFGHCASVEANLAQTRADMGKMQGSLAAAKQAIADLRTQLESEQQSAAAALASQRELQAKLDTLTERLGQQDGEAATQVKAMQQQLAAEKQAADDARKASSAATAELNARLTALEAENTRLKTDSKAVESQLNIARAEARNAQSASGKSLTQAKTRIEGLEKEIQSLSAQLDGKNKQIEQARQVATQASQKMRAGMQANTDLAGKLSAAEKELATLAALKTQHSALGQKAQQCDQQRTGLNASLTQARQERDAARAEAAAANKTGEACAADVSQLRAELGALRTELAQLKAAQADDDQDRVVNRDDQCPNTAPGRAVNAQGCEPDSDADGVADIADLCPGTPTGMEIDETGCPANQAIALEGVLFVTNSDRLLEESKAILDSVAETLRVHGNLKVEVAGHTDSAGDDAYNLGLSQRRAESVRQYLIDAGIAAERMSAQGYGEAEPVAINSSREGRALNRRVELRRTN